MAKIIVRQYVQIRRTVEIDVPDNATVHDAVKMLDNMPLALDGSEMPDNVTVLCDWDYLEDSAQYEDEDGEGL